MSARATMVMELENMIKNTMLDKNLIKTKLFYPYNNDRDFVLSHLENYKYNDGYTIFDKDRGLTLLYCPIDEEIINKAELIFEEDECTFYKLYDDCEETHLVEDEDDFKHHILIEIAKHIVYYDRDFHIKFNNILYQLEEEYQKEVREKIALNKIKRNKLFVLGLSMKVSMRDCGLPIEAY